MPFSHLSEANKNILQSIQTSCENNYPPELSCQKSRDLQSVMPTKGLYQASPIRNPLPQPPIPIQSIRFLEIIFRSEKSI